MKERLEKRLDDFRERRQFRGSGIIHEPKPSHEPKPPRSRWSDIKDCLIWLAIWNALFDVIPGLWQFMLDIAAVAPVE